MIEIKSIGTRSWLDGRSARALSAALSWRLQERCKGEFGVFITLTYDRTKYAGPVDLYRRCAEEQHVPLFLRKVARFLGEDLKGRWLCKLEFQKEGWVHWHILLLGVRKIPHAALKRLWSHGHTWVSRLDKRTVRYTCKYAVKADEVPAWLYAERPRSVKIIRVSPGFWGEPAREKKAKEPDPYETVPMQLPAYQTIGDRISHTEDRIVARDDRGSYRQVRVDLGTLLGRLLEASCAIVGRRGKWLVIDATLDEFETAAERAAADAASAAAPPLPLSECSNPDAEASERFRRSLPWWVDQWFRQGVDAIDRACNDLYHPPSFHGVTT